MENMDPILQHSAIWGLVLSIALGAIIVGSIKLNPEMWLDDYPPDIKAKFGAMRDKARKEKALVMITVFALVAGALILALIQLQSITGREPALLELFASTFTVLMVFNLFDLLVIDWLLMVTVRPGFIVLPGTEGWAGYSDYGFHFKGFLIGTAGSFVASLAIAGIATLAYVVI